ncbi:hypothetical protein AX15_006919 [Amanita polypyramis BW_CC]|nr:hypothetical protein AX15_006919 [Amanita polypyramis BW_CC]
MVVLMWLCLIRRAKAKLREGKVRSRMTDAQATESSPLSTDEHDANFCHTIFEEMRVTFIPCASLTIGTWKRMASEERRFDLVAYICESRQCLIWFLQSDRWAFKMAIPFNNINYTTFVNDGPGFSILSLHLSKPPQFYLYDCCRDRPCGWKPCSDWTEGYQASRILRHDLLGETMQMADLQQCIFRTKSIVFDHPTQKPIYPYIPTTQNRSHPLIGIPDEEKTVNTAQPTAESHNNNIPRCPSPEAQPYNHQTAIGSVSPVNGIARNTMQRRYLLEVECARSLPGLRPDIQLNGGYFNARS